MKNRWKMPFGTRLSVCPAAAACVVAQVLCNAADVRGEQVSRVKRRQVSEERLVGEIERPAR